jgi:cell wall-associated NlpC family hydrolase
LTTDDGLSVIAAALDSRVRLYSGNDCSHLVHAIYERAGFPYSYVSSSALYAGTKEFQRVKRAQPGDLVVWPGHVGIVVNPARHEFFSTLSSGPGIDTYDAPYWKQRGRLRFYRHIKTQEPFVSRRLVLAHQNK